jgi:type IV pilus assembly protein PilN
MIRINLLPEVSRKVTKKKAKPVRQIPVTWIIIGLVAVLLTCVILGVIQWAYNKKADNIREEIAAVQVEIRKLGIEIQKVDQFKAQKEDLEKKLNVIHQLKVAQLGPVRLLDQLASAIPPRLWLIEVSESGDAITILGASTELVQISTFVENLQKSPYFSDVELTSATSAASGGKTTSLGGGAIVKNFQLTGKTQFPKEL